MHRKFATLAALSALVLLASACGASTPAAAPIVVSSTPVAGYGGLTATPQSSGAVIPPTGSTGTPALAPAGTGTPAVIPAAGTATPAPPLNGGSPIPTVKGLPTAQAQFLVIEIRVVQNPQYGAILADGKGRTLYLRTDDSPRVSTCYGACTQTWPAAVPYGRKPSALPGIDPTKLGSVVRADGVVQVTYNNWPLYYYSGDTAPGQTNGQTSGGIWHVVTVNGDPVP